MTEDKDVKNKERVGVLILRHQNNKYDYRSFCSGE